MPMTKKQLAEFRKKVKETREGEWIRDAMRARKFSGTETLQMGSDLTKFAMELHEAAKHAKHK